MTYRAKSVCVDAANDGGEQRQGVRPPMIDKCSGIHFKRKKFGLFSQNGGGAQHPFLRQHQL